MRKKKIGSIVGLLLAASMFSSNCYAREFDLSDTNIRLVDGDFCFVTN